MEAVAEFRAADVLGFEHGKEMRKSTAPVRFATHRDLSDPECSERLDLVCEETRFAAPQVLRQVIDLAIEISVEGREGRKVGTFFVVGDEHSVLKKSRPLILDPLKGHAASVTGLSDPNLRETVKELAQLDGAFVVSAEGHVISAGRHINAHSEKIDLSLGLGSRHVAAASITQETKAVAVVVSMSSVVRLLDKGKIVAEIFCQP